MPTLIRPCRSLRERGDLQKLHPHIALPGKGCFLAPKVEGSLRPCRTRIIRCWLLNQKKYWAGPGSSCGSRITRGDKVGRFCHLKRGAFSRAYLFLARARRRADRGRCCECCSSRPCRNLGRQQLPSLPDPQSNRKSIKKIAAPAAGGLFWAWSCLRDPQKIFGICKRGQDKWTHPRKLSHHRRDGYALQACSQQLNGWVLTSGLCWCNLKTKKFTGEGYELSKM